MSKSPLSTDALLALDNQICFRLYAVSRALQRHYRQTLDTLGVTYPQYLVLLAMWQWHADDPSYRPTLGDITRRLYLDSGTVTPLVARMVSGGWLNKAASPADGRACLVSLTPKGLQLKQRARAVPESMLCFVNPETDYTELRRSLDSLLVELLPDGPSSAARREKG